MLGLEESVKLLDEYLEKILPGVDGNIEIEMGEDKENYYWEFDYDRRSFKFTLEKETGKILGESWKKGTKVQYKRH